MLLRDRVQPVRDNKGSTALHYFVKRVEQLGFGRRVQRAGRLVQNKYGSVLQKGASDGQSLPLSARETGSALADFGFVSARQGHNKFVRVGRNGGLNNLLPARVEASVGDVVGNSGGEEYRLLTNHSELLSQMRDTVAVEIDVVEQYTSAGRLVETRQQILAQPPRENRIERRVWKRERRRDQKPHAVPVSALHEGLRQVHQPAEVVLGGAESPCSELLGVRHSRC